MANVEVGAQQGSPQPKEGTTSIEAQETTAEVGSVSGAVDASPSDILPNRLTSKEIVANPMPSKQS